MLEITKKQLRYLTKFKNNLEEGIRYYNHLFIAHKQFFAEHKKAILYVLQMEQNKLNLMGIEIENL